MRGRVNCFDELRLIGALLVAISHSFAVVGLDQPLVNGRSLGMIGLFMFFGISGYLVSQSFERDQSVMRFLARRALRIFPGLAAVLVGTVFVLGPALSITPDYISHPRTWVYFFGSFALVATAAPPGVFTTNPLPGFNNSLWTLHIEFILYTMTPLLTVLFARKAMAGIALVAGAILACTITPEVTGWLIWHRALTLVGCFLMGAALNRLRFQRMSLLAAYAILLSIAVPVLFPAAVVVASIAWGETLIPSRFSVSQVGDLSYGIYLWAFPVQQAIAQLAGGGAMFNLAVTLLVITPIAYCSWRWIEKPALSLKPKGRTILAIHDRAPLPEPVRA